MCLGNWNIEFRIWTKCTGVWGKITPRKLAVFIKFYPTQDARMLHSEILPQTSKKFTQINLSYLWHFATLYSTGFLDSPLHTCAQNCLSILSVCLSFFHCSLQNVVINCINSVRSDAVTRFVQEQISDKARFFCVKHGSPGLTSESSRFAGFFLDAIASPSTYPCQWVSEWVIHSFKFRR